MVKQTKMSLLLAICCLAHMPTVYPFPILSNVYRAGMWASRPARRQWYNFKNAFPKTAKVIASLTKMALVFGATDFIKTKANRESLRGNRRWRAAAPYISLACDLANKAYTLSQLATAQQLFTGAEFVPYQETGNTRFEDIGGVLPAQVRVLEDFIRHPEKYRNLGDDSPLKKGILLSGAPGTGKTMLAKAIANEFHVPFFPVSSPSISSKWLGQSAENIKALFEKAREAAELSGNNLAIVFFDEFDAIGKNRGSGINEDDRVVNALLTELDGFDENNNVLVLAATNNPLSIDEALTRNGRFDFKIEVPMPNDETRGQIWQRCIMNMAPELRPADIDAQNVDAFAHQCAQLSNGLSQADIVAVVRKVKVNACHNGGAEQPRHVTRADLLGTDENRDGQAIHHVGAIEKELQSRQDRAAARARNQFDAVANLADLRERLQAAVPPNPQAGPAQPAAAAHAPVDPAAGAAEPEVGNA